MRKRTLMSLLFIFWLVLALLDVCRAEFKVSDCVFNKQFQQVKKITKVRFSAYEYCIYTKNNCENKYNVRKRWFDNNHTKIKCPTK